MATQYPLDDNSIQPAPGKVAFDIFGPMQKSDVRVGYIDPDRGYITGVNVCAANAHAKLNPGAQFILDTRDHVRFMNINEVNNLTPDDYDSSGLPGNVNPCKGAELVVDDPKPPLVEFNGGGGVGAKGNPLIGDDGSLLGVHLIERGYGYKYAPLVDIKSSVKLA